MKSLPVRDIGRVLLGTAAILMLPLLGMQFSKEVNWSPGDFVLMGALISGTGFMYLIVARQVTSRGQRLLVGAGLLLTLLLVWVELAVGVFGTPFAGS
jgi:hypothetical protein